MKNNKSLSPTQSEEDFEERSFQYKKVISRYSKLVYIIMFRIIRYALAHSFAQNEILHQFISTKLEHLLISENYHFTFTPAITIKPGWRTLPRS